MIDFPPLFSSSDDDEDTLWPLSTGTDPADGLPHEQ